MTVKRSAKSPYLNIDLGGIPIDTKTLAGQWMTFSHMANHYRKLLNVKPRVDTGLAPSGSFHNHTMQSSKSANKMGCVPSKWRNSSTNSTRNNNNNSNSMYNSRESMRLLYGSHPDHLNTCSGKTVKEGKSPLKAKTKKQTVQQYSPHHHQEYQVVFGPSSIRSSTDAFLSDETESLMSNDKPPLAPIGVTEKIRRFLNHIHQLDLTTTSTIAKPKRVTTAPVTCPLKSERPAKVPSGKGRSTPTSGTANLGATSTIDFRLSRHSKCFLPCEPKSPSKKSTTITSPAPTKSKKILDKSGSSKKATKVVAGESHSNGYAHQFHSPRMSRKLFTEEDLHIMLPEKELCSSSKKPGKSRKRAGSMASIGTICGSDVLTAEDFPISIKDICSTIERAIAPEDDLIHRMSDNHRKSKKVEEHTSSRKPVGKASRHSSGVRISSSMTSLVPSSSKSTNANGNGSAQVTNNNKDSSRDSAYGFSSGESRITTRESTPEKKCREFISNANSHVDLQDKPCKDLQILEDFHNSTTNKSSSSNLHKHHRSSKDHHTKSHNHSKKESPFGKRTRSTYDLRKQQSSERYITFLAEVTQDIVSKGIYTNKGLKNLFKSHMDQNKELNHDKLSDMMERLRMDLGIPKDDALDKIEFGYGSISSTAKNTFFYTPSTDKVSMSSVTSKMDANANVDTSLPSTSSSHPTKIPNVSMPATTNTTTTTGFFSSGPNTSSNQSTTDEGGDVISGPSSEHDDDNDKNHDNYVDDEDELNFREEEVTQALKLAGLDDGANEEVMEILNI
ncbi:Spermatogenesis-associated protein 7 [Orchesella cincta]|uniref:Spermatogenesis-associated protein 7 n=1 Tax=Orchesella cincta TaxID=48709 RepID=A0A1D2MLZ5_ORCCI|nr:Spermatogenesis-associated protein 7 [Orchesella cincta]